MIQNDNADGAATGTAIPDGSAAVLMPIIAMVFIAYLVIGLAMPVLPLHVHLDLGLGTFVVGLVSGGQFAALPWSSTGANSRAIVR